jgi:hypothetical protein
MMARMQARRALPRRIFVSCTSDLQRYPVGYSFVAAAEKAIGRYGDAVRHMGHIGAQARPPAEVCEKIVRESDVYVLIAGLRYGSPVRGRPELSYTELEFEAASKLPRLVFLLADDTPGPDDLVVDRVHGVRQAAFRRRLRDSGLTVEEVRTPAQLEAALLHALTQLPRPRPVNSGSPRYAAGRSARVFVTLGNSRWSRSPRAVPSTLR